MLRKKKNSGSRGTGQEKQEEDELTKLERLFAKTEVSDSEEDLDAPPAINQEPSEQQQTQQAQEEDQRPILKQYIAKFDQQTMIETSRLVSIEGAAIVEMQTTALFGDVKQLQKEMQNAVGKDFISLEELMTRVKKAVEEGSVASITMKVGAQRHAVLEAVAFGSILRDIETTVQETHDLLTPLPPPKAMGGPGGYMGPGGPIGGPGSLPGGASL
eukprot:TRINITY_DN5546_c0_g1_i3.p1 TRINITY_DN5546_c0_g1~~TRINITY_DN5546_c0_g1_i3.p1  ORF type:complete len:215 (-),score=53.16 TRINITY_DN5546_c0_g1_i3:1199-1843(-)